MAITTSRVIVLLNIQHLIAWRILNIAVFITLNRIFCIPHRAACSTVGPLGLIFFLRVLVRQQNVSSLLVPVTFLILEKFGRWRVDLGVFPWFQVIICCLFYWKLVQLFHLYWGPVWQWKIVWIVVLLRAFIGSFDDIFTIPTTLAIFHL